MSDSACSLSGKVIESAAQKPGHVSQTTGHFKGSTTLSLPAVSSDRKSPFGLRKISPNPIATSGSMECSHRTICREILRVCPSGHDSALCNGIEVVSSVRHYAKYRSERHACQPPNRLEADSPETVVVGSPLRAQAEIALLRDLDVAIAGNA